MRKKVSFEEGMKQLEMIVTELERGEVPLEKSMALFDEGTKLSALLAQQLDTAEQKLTVILQANEAPEAQIKEQLLVLGEE